MCTRTKLIQVIKETESWLFRENLRVNNRWPDGIIQNKKKSLDVLKKMLLDLPEQP
jgi:hypothetical protein